MSNVPHPQAYITQTQFDKLIDQVATMQSSIDRLTPVVESLTVIADDLRTIINHMLQEQAVVKSRLDFQEKYLDKLQEHIEKRRNEYDMETKAFYSRIERIEKEIRDDFEEKIYDLQNTAKKNEEEMLKKHSSLEKWMWTMAGGCTLAIWAVQQFLIPLIAN